MGQLGTDDPNAPQNASAAEAAMAAMDLKPVAASAPAGKVNAPVPAAASDGTVTLATVAPLGSITLPALSDDGQEVVITEDGTEVDAATAERAHAVAMKNGFRLREL